MKLAVALQMHIKVIKNIYYVKNALHLALLELLYATVSKLKNESSKRGLSPLHLLPSLYRTLAKQLFSVQEKFEFNQVFQKEQIKIVIMLSEILPKLLPLPAIHCYAVPLLLCQTVVPFQQKRWLQYCVCTLQPGSTSK